MKKKRQETKRGFRGHTANERLSLPSLFSCWGLAETPAVLQL